MAITSISIFVAFLIGGFGLAFFVGAIILQMHLSKKDNKWLSLVLPIICFLIAITTIISTPTFNQKQTSVQEILPDRTSIEHQNHTTNSDIDSVSLAIQVVSVFFIYNVPTVILILIYFVGRKNIKKNSEINKMNIQDLE